MLPEQARLIDAAPSLGDSLFRPVGVVPPSKSLRLAILINLAPRKKGSFEDWVVALAETATRRGHTVDVFGFGPVHPGVASALQRAGAGWADVGRLMQRPVNAILRLARHYDVAHINLFAPRSLAACIAYAAWPTRVLFVDHISVSGGDLEQPAVRRFLDRMTMARVAGVAGVSQFVRDRTQHRFGLHAARVRAIYNGVDVYRFRPAGVVAKQTADLRVLTAANLIPEKGVEYLLRAVAQFGDSCVRLQIAGDGPEEPRLRALARELRIDEQTEFLGLRNDLPDLLRRADVFVHPATWHEAFGNTVVEAMASGCAVVASRVGAIPELIEHEESGLLVSPGDVKALARALRRLRDDPELRRRLGINARTRAVEHFSLETSVQRHLTWCEELALR